MPYPWADWRRNAARSLAVVISNARTCVCLLRGILMTIGYDATKSGATESSRAKFFVVLVTWRLLASPCSVSAQWSLPMTLLIV
jgi:hypothetical protein